MTITTTQIERAIAEANDRFMRAFREADAAAIASMYTEEAQLLPPGSGVAHGWEAIRAFWQGAMDAGVAAAELTIAEVEQHGDIVVELSRYTLRGADGGALDRGKYIVVWRRERGAWRLHRDIFNSDGPPAAA